MAGTATRKTKTTRRRKSTSGNGKEEIQAPGKIEDSGLIQFAADKILIPKVESAFLQLSIEGTTRLVVHKFSEKTLRQMADKQQGKGQTKKPPKDPQQEYEQALYHLPKSTKKKPVYGFPAVGMKKAMVSACRFAQGITMTYARMAFHVVGTDDDDLMTIQGNPERRMDAVRVGPQKVADLRYRPQFQKWCLAFIVRYNTRAITPEQLANLVNLAGFHVGLGENRPEKSGGSWGTFQVK